MTQIETTPRKGISAKYNISQPSSKQRQHSAKRAIVKCTLLDAHGVPIDGTTCQVTQKAGQDLVDVKKNAMHRALEKFDKLGFATIINDNNNAHFFSDSWHKLSTAEKLALVSDAHQLDKDKQPVVTYFENNVLPLLDQYGPLISPDQCLAVSSALYLSLMRSKKYKDKRLEPASYARELIDQFFSKLEKWFTSDCSACNRFANNDSGVIPSFIAEAKNKVANEDRFFVLLSNHISVLGVDTVLASLQAAVSDDAVLIINLPKLNHPEAYSTALDALLFRLREICSNASESKNGVNIHLLDANIILENWVAAVNMPFPSVALPLFDVAAITQVELVKEFSWAVRVMFSEIIMDKAADSNYACGAAAMLASGPRVAEVCAIRFGDILPVGKCGLVVLTHTVDGKIIVSTGKNKGFRRTVFFPYFVMCAIELRKRHLRFLGYTEGEINRAFIACNANDIFAPILPQQFSLNVKADMTAAGCDEEYWVAVRKAMVEDADVDFCGNAEMFDSAYGLRRDAISMMVNVAKMPPLMVEAIVGHKLPRRSKRYDKIITRDDEWSGILSMLSRVVYSPKYTEHPFYQPIELDGSSVPVNTAMYQGVSFLATKEITVKLRIRTVGCSPIFVGVTGSSRILSTNSHDVLTMPTSQGGSSLAIPPYLSDALHDPSEFAAVIQPFSKKGGTKNGKKRKEEAVPFGPS